MLTLKHSIVFYRYVSTNVQIVVSVQLIASLMNNPRCATHLNSLQMRILWIVPQCQSMISQSVNCFISRWSIQRPLWFSRTHKWWRSRAECKPIRNTHWDNVVVPLIYVGMTMDTDIILFCHTSFVQSHVCVDAQRSSNICHVCIVFCTLPSATVNDPDMCSYGLSFVFDSYTPRSTVQGLSLMLS